MTVDTAIGLLILFLLYLGEAGHCYKICCGNGMKPARAAVASWLWPLVYVTCLLGLADE